MDKVSYSNPFSALKHKNFRYYLMGMCISLIGTWMQNIAQPWLAYSLTNSPFLLSLVGTLQFLPTLLLSLFAGVIIDRFPKKRILLFTQSASIFITLALAILVWTGRIQYWHILVTATALGLVNTLDMPTRQSFVIELVGKEDLMNAVALNSTVFNGARIIGPAVAGIVMAWFGVATCFFINSVSFTAVVIGLLFIKPIELHEKHRTKSKIWADIKDGLKYIYRHEVLFETLIGVGIVGMFIMNFSVLVPVFAKDILNQKETGFGFLMSFLGLGSLIGAMLVATMSKDKSGKFTNFILDVMPFAVSIFMFAIGLTNKYLLAGICLALTGFSFVSFTSTANSTMQLNMHNKYRGRVMSVYTLVMAGSTPLGNLYAGIITEHFGANVGFAACGAISILLLIPLYIYKIRAKRTALLIEMQRGCHSNKKTCRLVKKAHD